MELIDVTAAERVASVLWGWDAKADEATCQVECRSARCQLKLLINIFLRR